MNDSNQALLIGMVATFITGVLIPLVTHYLKMNELKKLKDEVSATKEDVHKVELATNSMKDQLVTATRLASHAEGMQAEQDAQKMRESEQAKGAAGQVAKQADIDRIPKGSIGP
jgi:uncharacterized protein (DUF1800 family)